MFGVMDLVVVEVPGETSVTEGISNILLSSPSNQRSRVGRYSNSKGHHVAFVTAEIRKWAIKCGSDEVIRNLYGKLARTFTLSVSIFANDSPFSCKIRLFHRLLHCYACF